MSYAAAGVLIGGVAAQQGLELGDQLQPTDLHHHMHGSRLKSLRAHEATLPGTPKYSSFTCTGGPQSLSLAPSQGCLLCTAACFTKLHAFPNCVEIDGPTFAPAGMCI